MEWNGMKSLAPWTIKLSRTTQLSVWTGEETTRLTSSSPFSRRKYIWNALFDVSTRKKLTSAREMCEEMQEIEIETAPESPGLPLPFPSFQPSSFFLLMKERWRLIQTDFNETFHNFVSWILNISLSFWYFFIWRKKKLLFRPKMHFSYLNVSKS